MAQNRRAPIIFLDTSVLLTAFAAYHHGHELPYYITDDQAKRFTFEKCVFEAYMAFRGIGGKKPDEGRQDWANRHLNQDGDPVSLDKLAGRYHGSVHAMALYWLSRISENDLESLSENSWHLLKPDEQEDVFTDLNQRLLLQEQQSRFLDLCDKFRQMLNDTLVTVASYVDIFDRNPQGTGRLNAAYRLANLHALDGLVRQIAIPSEDFEIVYAAMRIWTDIFVTNDKRLMRCAISLDENLPLHAASFCLAETYNDKVEEYRSGVKAAHFPS